MNAADRLVDGFPHGTPDGYRQGCRGNGACPNRPTTRMTCLEAQQRYQRDLPYRRAYDRGDIWLDRPIPLDSAAQQKIATRARLARATGADRTTTAAAAAVTLQPEPAAQPAPPTSTTAVEEPPTAPAAKPRERGWRHGTTYAYETKHCRCDICTAAMLEKRRRHLAGTFTGASVPGRTTTAAHDAAPEPVAPPLTDDRSALEARIRELEQQLADADTRRLAAEEDAAHADRAREVAEREQDRLRTQLAGQPPHRPAIEIHTQPATDGMQITLTGLLAPETAKALADYLVSQR